MRPQRVPVNVYETPAALVILAPMPAVTPADVTIELEPGHLRFWAHLRSAGPRPMLLQEWDYGGYERDVAVPPGYRRRAWRPRSTTASSPSGCCGASSSSRCGCSRRRCPAPAGPDPGSSVGVDGLDPVRVGARARHGGRGARLRRRLHPEGPTRATGHRRTRRVCAGPALRPGARRTGRVVAARVRPSGPGAGDPVADVPPGRIWLGRDAVVGAGQDVPAPWAARHGWWWTMTSVRGSRADPASVLGPIWRAAMPASAPCSWWTPPTPPTPPHRQVSPPPSSPARPGTTRRPAPRRGRPGPPGHRQRRRLPPRPRHLAVGCSRRAAGARLGRSGRRGAARRHPGVVRRRPADPLRRGGHRPEAVVHRVGHRTRVVTPAAPRPRRRRVGRWPRISRGGRPAGRDRRGSSPPPARARPGC